LQVAIDGDRDFFASHGHFKQVYHRWNALGLVPRASSVNWFSSGVVRCDILGSQESAPLPQNHFRHDGVRAGQPTAAIDLHIGTHTDIGFTKGAIAGRCIASWFGLRRW
jgi:hypothetical protein